MFFSYRHSSSGAASPSFPLLLRSASRGITTAIKIIWNSPRVRPNIFTDCSPKLLLPVFYLRGKMESAAPASSLSLTLFNPFILSSQLKSRLYTSCGIAAHSDIFCFVCSITSSFSATTLTVSPVALLSRRATVQQTLHAMFLLAEQRNSERSELSPIKLH